MPRNLDVLADSVVKAAQTYIASALAIQAKQIQALSAKLDAIELKPGPEGDPGESIKGDPGEKGEPGNGVVVGDGPPLINGSAGDTYIDAKSGDIWRYL